MYKCKDYYAVSQATTITIIIQTALRYCKARISVLCISYLDICPLYETYGGCPPSLALT